MTYQEAIEYLKDIKREDLFVNNPKWPMYKEAIEAKVKYEMAKEKETK